MICSITDSRVLVSSYGPGVAETIDGLVHPVLELLEGQRAVVQRARQPEPVLHQILLAGAVAVIHALELRHGLMAFVDEHAANRPADNPAAWAEPGPAAARKSAANNSRSRGNSRSGGSFPDRTWSAARCAAPRSVCPVCRVPPSTSVSSFSMLRSASLARLLAHHVVRFGIHRQAQIGLLHLARSTDRSVPAIRFRRPTG